MWGLLPLRTAGCTAQQAMHTACAAWLSSTSSSSSSASSVWQHSIGAQSRAPYHSSSHAARPSGSHGHTAVTHATTILAVRKDGEVVVMGDGQATQDAFVVKANVTKVRRIADGVIGGFAGRAADGLSLLERLEMKLEEHPGQLQRAAVELAKDWRQDRVLRNLEALLLVADARNTLWLSGTGDVIEAPDGVMGIGSGSDYAEAAARALMELPGLSAMSIAHKAMRIAADCCVYTNSNFAWQQITKEGQTRQGRADAKEVHPANDEEPAIGA